MADFPYLPPLGSADADAGAAALLYLANLVTEDANRRPIDAAESNVAVFEAGDESNDVQNPALVNDAANAVIAATDLQLREPPLPTLKPREVGEGGPRFWTGPAEMMPAQPMQDPLSGAVAAVPLFDPMQPLPEAMVQMLGAMGLERFVVTVDDTTKAKFGSDVFQAFWQRSQCDQWLRRNLLRTNVQGYQPVWYRFDKWRKRHVLRHWPLCQFYVDSCAESIEDAAWCVLDIVLDKAEAIALFPDLQDKIEEHAKPGTPDTFDNGRWGTACNRDFQRPVVAMRLAWLRYQPIPLTTDEAVQFGGVAPAKQMVQTGIDETTQMPVMEEQDIPGQYMLGDAPVAPGEPAWPSRPGIREIIQIGREKVRDQECDEWDIPVLVNINRPIIGTMFGQGEPAMIRELQKAKNRAYNSVVDHLNYYRYPIGIGPASMVNALGGKVDMLHPGQFYKVQDNTFIATQNARYFIEPPQMPPALPNGIAQITSEMDKQSQHAPVMQGYAPGASSSGKQVELLQQAASSTISDKARVTSYMLQRIARLMLHAMQRDLTLMDVMQVVSRYPEHVAKMLWDGVVTGDWDFEIEVTAGTQTAALARQQKDLSDLGAGAISMQTYREGQKIDHGREEQRIKEQMRQQAAMQMEAMAGMPAPQGKQPPKKQE